VFHTSNTYQQLHPPTNCWPGPPPPWPEQSLPPHTPPGHTHLYAPPCSTGRTERLAALPVFRARVCGRIRPTYVHLLDPSTSSVQSEATSPYTGYGCDCNADGHRTSAYPVLPHRRHCRNASSRGGRMAWHPERELDPMPTNDIQCARLNTFALCVRPPKSPRRTLLRELGRWATGTWCVPPRPVTGGSQNTANEPHLRSRAAWHCGRGPFGSTIGYERSGGFST
jgi:hypothetical protein